MKTLSAKVTGRHQLELSETIPFRKGTTVNVRVTAAKRGAGDRSLLSVLRKIRIKGPVDFSKNVHAYASGEKHAR